MRAARTQTAARKRDSDIADLKYSGELYQITGNAAKAGQRLATLDAACTFSREEYTDLKKAVGRHKANGNTYIAAP